MAILTSSTTPANGTEGIFNLIDLLCTAGWTIPQWSDGSTLTTPGADLTTNPYGSSSSGAGNLGNPDAWFRIRPPGSSREWMLQRNSTDRSWKVLRSKLGFTGGSPTATVLPTDVTSGVSLIDGTLWSASPDRWLISAESSAPYGFTGFTVVVGGGNVKTVLFDEPLMAGTYPSADLDPVMAGCYYNNTGFDRIAFAVATFTGVVVYKRYLHGNPAATNVRINYYYFAQQGGNRVAPADGGGSQMGPSPYNSSEIPVPITTGVNGSLAVNTGWSGITNRHKWGTVGSRNNGQTLYDSTNSLYWIYCGGIWIPWDSSTPII